MRKMAARRNCEQSWAIHPPHKRIQEWTNLVIRRLPSLNRMARRWLDNTADAEDAVQDALLSAFTHLDQFKGQAQMSTWLTAIVINSARMKLRRRQRQLHVPLDRLDREQDQHTLLSEAPDRRPNPEQICRRRELLGLLARCLPRLSPVLRKAVQLRIVDELSFSETAKGLRVPEGTAKSRVARARARLKQLCNEGSSLPIDRNQGSIKHSVD